MTELVDPVGQLTAKSFHPRALIDGDNRPLVTLSDALDVLARSEKGRDRLRAVVNIVRDAFTCTGDDDWRIDTGALVVLADALDGLDEVDGTAK